MILKLDISTQTEIIEVEQSSAGADSSEVNDLVEHVDKLQHQLEMKDFEATALRTAIEVRSVVCKARLAAC